MEVDKTPAEVTPSKTTEDAPTSGTSESIEEVTTPSEQDGSSDATQNIESTDTEGSTSDQAEGTPSTGKSPSLLDHDYSQEVAETASTEGNQPSATLESVEDSQETQTPPDSEAATIQTVSEDQCEEVLTSDPLFTPANAEWGSQENAPETPTQVDVPDSDLLPGLEVTQNGTLVVPDTQVEEMDIDPKKQNLKRTVTSDTDSDRPKRKLKITKPKQKPKGQKSKSSP